MPTTTSLPSVGWRLPPPRLVPPSVTPLIDASRRADFGRRADHDAHAVIDEERRPILADGWISMPVAKRDDVREETRHERNAERVSRWMSDAR